VNIESQADRLMKNFNHSSPADAVLSLGGDSFPEYRYRY
jgi:hypothetical protein